MNNSLAANGEHPLQVVANKMKIGKAERRFAEGKWWLVAPITTIPANGILNGSKGPGFYPSAETQASVRAWDGMPLTSLHPMDEMGRHTSAKAPGVLDRQGIGVVRDSVWKNKLLHNGWFDEEKTKKVNPTIYNNLINRIPIETSTGLYTDSPAAPNGSHHNGRPYTWTAKNYRPDHVAVLVGQIGACSINDGCGVLVNVAGNPVTATQGLVTNQAVHMDHWIENCSCNGTCSKCKPSLNSLTINPFVSESQRRACYAADDPNWDCDEWNDKTKGKLPEKKPGVENLLGSLSNLHARPSLLQVVNYDPGEARDEQGHWTYTGGAGARGETLHKYAVTAHKDTMAFAGSEKLKKYMGTALKDRGWIAKLFGHYGALATSERALKESSVGNHELASKYHLTAATMLSRAANAAIRPSILRAIATSTLGESIGSHVGSGGDKWSEGKLRELAAEHLYAGSEAGGSKGFREANKLTEESHRATNTADKHKVAWLHHAAVNAHLNASQAWKDKANEQGDEFLKKTLNNLAADHQKQAWEHGKAASQAEVGGSTKAAPQGAEKDKYEFLKPSTNQLGLKPSLVEVENFNPFHDLKGKFASAGEWAGKKAIAGAAGAGAGTLAGSYVGHPLHGGIIGGIAGVLPKQTFALPIAAAKISAATLLRGVSGGLSETARSGKELGSYLNDLSKPTVKGITKLGSAIAGRAKAAYEMVSGSPPSYKPTIAPTFPELAGRKGTGAWGPEYQGTTDDKAGAILHRFSLTAQNSSTTSIDPSKIGWRGGAGIKSAQEAYRAAQLGNHGTAAEKHARAAELLQTASDGMKSWKLQAMEKALKSDSGKWIKVEGVRTFVRDEKKDLTSTQKASLTEKDKQALFLQKAAGDNRLAAIMQGNSTLTKAQRTATLLAIQASTTADSPRVDTPSAHLHASKVNTAAAEKWNEIVAAEHNPYYKDVYSELAQKHKDLAKQHREIYFERLQGSKKHKKSKIDTLFAIGKLLEGKEGSPTVVDEESETSHTIHPDSGDGRGPYYINEHGRREYRI